MSQHKSVFCVLVMFLLKLGVYGSCDAVHRSSLKAMIWRLFWALSGIDCAGLDSGFEAKFPRRRIVDETSAMTKQKCGEMHYHCSG